MHHKRDPLDEAISQLEDAERGGMPAEAVAGTWRFAGIVDLEEVMTWLDVGIFDGHRAGLLKMAGVTPNQLAALPNARQLGLEFALGRLSVMDVRHAVASPHAPPQTGVH